MIEVETSGLYSYTVTGKRESEAADYLSQRLEFLDRSLAYGMLSSEDYLVELEDMSKAIEEKYDVKVGTTV